MDPDDPTVDDAERQTRVRDVPGAEPVPQLGARYRIGEAIGRGGMGEVLAAVDAQIGRDVAIKRMRQPSPSTAAMTRFFREASIQGRLDHPSIVPVYELGVDETGRPFFAMKKLKGTTLRALIAAGHPRTKLLRAFADVCLAIELAHTRGVVHRDLKPENIVLGDFGETYVIDWGVAKTIADEREVFDDETGEPLGLATAAGVVVGTPVYMAPEQLVDARDVDPRADVYALGCVLFEILAGESLHRRRDTGVAFVPVDARPSIRAPGRDVPPELDALCVAATALDRDARIATARELADRVERYLDGDRDLALRTQLARDHLMRARDAFRFDDETSRRTAMREAGRALALDPALVGAGELVGRLMVELPRTTPPEVARMIQAHDVRTLAAQARSGAWTFAGLAFLPIALAAMAPRHPGYALAIAGALGLLLALVLGGGLGTRARTIRLAVGAAVLVALLARAFSPVLVAPTAASMLAMGLALSPTYVRWRHAIALVALLALAIAVPWLLEAAGALSPTLSVDGAGVAITAAALDYAPPVRIAVLALFVAGAVAMSGCLGHATRRAENQVRRELHLQAWQLRQIVPDNE